MEKKIVGIIGAGAIGTAFARLALAAGANVLLSNSRGPESLADLADELGPNARAVTVAEAASASDFVVVSIPYHQINSLPANELAGKIIIDPSNYAAVRDGHIAEIDNEALTASGYLQEKLPQSFVVKAFGNINASSYAALARPRDAEDRAALPIAGDDDAAISAVSALMDKMGFDPLFAGPLSESWRFEPFMPAFVVPYLADVKALLDFHATRTDGSGQPPADNGRQVKAEELRDLLASAKRGTTMEEFWQSAAELTHD